MTEFGPVRSLSRYSASPPQRGQAAIERRTLSASPAENPAATMAISMTCSWNKTLASEAHRAQPRVGTPLASDDENALAAAFALVVDAGFDPVVVGNLDRAREFDVGAPVHTTGMSGPEVRRTLNIAR